MTDRPDGRNITSIEPSALGKAWSSSDRLGKCVIALLFALVVANIYFVFFGHPEQGDDSWNHFNWLEQFTRLYAGGLAYPRWMSASNGGFGSATFYFYPPLMYFIAAWVNDICRGLTPYQLYQIFQVAGSLLSGVAFYLFVSRIGLRGWQGIAASILYTCIDYRADDIYLRAALGEHWGFVWVPVVFLSLIYALESGGGRERSYRILLLSAFAWAGLLLTSIPTAIIVGTACGGLFIVRRKESSVLRVASWILGALLGVALAAFYILPVFHFRPLVHLNHLWDVFTFKLPDYMLLRIFSQDVKTFHIRRVLMLFAAGGIGWWLFRSLRRSNLSADKRLTTQLALVCCALAIFFQLPYISSPLWDYLPGLSTVQFTWRWDILLVVAFALSYAALERTEFQKWINWTLIGLMAITLVAGIRISLSRSHYGGTVHQEHFDSPEWAPIHTNPVRQNQEAYMVAHQNDAPITLLSPSVGDTAQMLASSPSERRYAVQLAKATEAKFHMYYWPQWKLRNGSAEIATTPDTAGVMAAMLPAGKYELQLLLERSDSEIAGVNISLGASALFILLAALGFMQSRKRIA
jgi:hypothetical protein